MKVSQNEHPVSKPSKRSRLITILIGVGIFLLILLAGLVYASSLIQNQSRSTPIAPIPDLDSVSNPTEMRRTLVYDEQISERKKLLRQGGKPKQRIRNPWGFYTANDTVSKEIKTEEVQRPKRSFTPRQSRPIPKSEEPRPNPTPSTFNLILEEESFHYKSGWSCELSRNYYSYFLPIKFA